MPSVRGGAAPGRVQVISQALPEASERFPESKQDDKCHHFYCSCLRSQELTLKVRMINIYVFVKVSDPHAFYLSLFVDFLDPQECFFFLSFWVIFR